MRKVIYLASLAIMTFSAWGVTPFERQNENQRDRGVISSQLKKCSKLESAIDACNKQKKSKEKLQKLLKDFGDLNSQILKSEKYTPLMYASVIGNCYAVEEILKFENVNVNQKWDKSGATALIMSACNHRENVIDLLLKRRDIQIDLADNENVTPLLYAATRGYKKILDKLIEHGANVNNQDILGNTPIICAIANGFIDLINPLIEAGADVNQKNNQGRSALMMEIIKSHTGKEEIKVDNRVDLVKELFEAVKEQGKGKININDKDNDDNTAFIMAAHEGLVDVIDELMKYQEIKFDQKNKHGDNAMMLAAQNDQRDVVKRLLDIEYFRKTINDKNNEQKSAFFIATVEGYSDLVNILLEAKDENQKRIVDINTQVETGATPLSTALYNNFFDIAEKLIDQDDVDVTKIDQFSQTSLMHAVYKGKKDIAEKILKKVPEEKRKVYIDTRTKHQDYSALTAAVLKNETEIVKLLLDYGADANAQLKNTPLLIYAAISGYTEIVKLLLDAGANISKTTAKGETALDIVQRLRNREEIIWLLKDAAGMPQQVKPNIKQLRLSTKEINSRFRSVLDKIFNEENMSEEEIKELLEQYDVDGKRMITNDSINQVFLEISKKGYAGMLDLLLPCVEDLNVQDNNGNTALMLAVDSGHDMLVQILLNYYGKRGENQYVKVNSEIKNNNGKTALMIAVDRRNKDIIKILQNFGAKVSSSNSEKKYKRDEIKKLLNEEKGQNQQNEMILSTGFPVYAGNTFHKQLEELDDNLKKKVREIIQRVQENPYYSSEGDEHFESLEYGCYSRRLNDKHRFIYRVLGGAIQCLFCKDHNKDLDRSDKTAISGMVCKYKWKQNNEGKYDFVRLDHEERGRLNDIANGIVS